MYHDGYADGYENALATPPAALDVERLARALEWDMKQAQAMFHRQGVVFLRDLSKVVDKSDNAPWWEKVAFSLYTMLTPHGERVAAIAAAYQQYDPPEREPDPQPYDHGDGTL
jgi:hypothetical protein